MVGYQLLARFLTTIDYANFKLTLAMPSVGPAAGVRRRPGRVLHRGHHTAYPDQSLTASRPLPKSIREIAPDSSSPRHSSRHTRRSPHSRKLPPGAVGFGVGGPAYARLGRVPALQIGPYTITNTIASLTYQSDRRVRRSVQSRQHRRRDLAALRRNLRLRALPASARQEREL